MSTQDNEEKLKGRTVESACLGGKYATIVFTDGSRLDLEAVEGTPEEVDWYGPPSPEIIATLTEKKSV